MKYFLFNLCGHVYPQYFLDMHDVRGGEERVKRFAHFVGF